MTKHRLTLKERKGDNALDATCSCGKWRYTGLLGEATKLASLFLRHLNETKR